MRKILSIGAMIIYLFSINTLVHASTMGFFSDSDDMPASHCHAHQQSPHQKSADIDCCELAFSNQYSDTHIQLEYYGSQTPALPIINHLIKDPAIYEPSLTYREWPP